MDEKTVVIDPSWLLASTLHLSAEQFGAMMRLRLAAEITGGLPNNKHRLNRIAGCNVSKEVMEWFADKEDDGSLHPLF